ncbi:hypothetical protein BFJ63_vAg15974 [Fusarium oxysporum f. sp. narcissi]|uniref:AAA+ ATPase domain-containing protein n=1 Tax=Fusarium oxysporum f. sp. narcissi TaxID=451672 RepID=A0A4Q2VAR1_FUSOX|nr:hypothetical protein BFJ63_vAg15974 [Fusarium oxysporum f. sp. narcissi]
MIEYLTPSLMGAMTPFINNLYGRLACALVAVWWLRYSIFEWLPSVKIPEHDIYSRLMFVWTSRCRPELSSYSCTLYQSPVTMNMARYFQMASDPVERDIDEMFWVPRGPKLFVYDGHIFIFSPENLLIYTFWINNKPAQRFAEIELAKYLKNNKLQQHTAHDDGWVDQPRPKRLAENHHEDLNAMIAEVGDFFDAEHKYAKEGRKWKRVFLLHGAPGTGKTAMPDVIASVLDVPLYRHSCGSTDDQFRRLINATRPKSLVVFDEIDQLSAAQPDKGGDDTEGSERQPIKKQTLQSWLCGELGAEGTAIFLTTNYLRKIDEVIRRPQRVDKMVHFPAELTKGTINKILQIRYDNEKADSGLKEKYSKEELPEICISFSITKTTSPLSKVWENGYWKNLQWSIEEHRPKTWMPPGQVKNMQRMQVQRCYRRMQWYRDPISSVR